MKFNYRHIRVSDIPLEGLELSFNLESSSLNSRINAPLESTKDNNFEALEFNYLMNIPVEIRLESDGSTILLNGEVSGSFESDCIKCLEKVKKDFSIPLSIVLNQKKSAKNDLDDQNYYLFKGEVLDVAPVIEEEIILNTPDHVSCSENCKGLCPSCGTNLNSRSCMCNDSKNANSVSSTQEETYNPFSKLNNLIKH